MTGLAAALRKEALLQWRSRAQLLAVFVFGATALLLFSFAVGPRSDLLREIAAGFLWLGLLLASTLTLAESYQAEMEQRALDQERQRMDQIVNRRLMPFQLALPGPDAPVTPAEPSLAAPPASGQ